MTVAFFYRGDGEYLYISGDGHIGMGYEGNGYGLLHGEEPDVQLNYEDDDEGA